MEHSQIENNVTLEQAMRRANLLSAAAEVSRHVTQIMDIEELLPKMVDIICDAYNFYYAGVFLIDGGGDYAVLRAGRGEPGQIMMENNHKLAVGGNSMIGACTALHEARISLDVDTEKVWYPNPVLPETRSEMALPLAIGNRIIGAITVQSVEEAAFSEEDISSLQTMANQLAIALDNARQRKELEESHAELLRAKTFEAIAAATGDAIHWIGNKAEPIGASIGRIRHDVKLFLMSVAHILQHSESKEQASSELAEWVADQPLAQLLLKESAAIKQKDPELSAEAARLSALSLNKLEKRLNIPSILDDLEIIEDAARLIMKVKEDLIGPAREQAPRPIMIDDVVQDAMNSVDIPPNLLDLSKPDALPLVLADPVQLNRVFVNLLQNAYEAMENQAQPQITVSIQVDEDSEFVSVSLSDNGSGIAEANLDKIWITFYTTKGIKGHSGLGLPACRLILKQLGGSISVSSVAGEGATCRVEVPLYQGKESEAGPEGAASILLIDDDDNWRIFASETLTEAGYKVTLCGDDYSVSNPTQYELILIDDILAQDNSLDIMQAIKSAGAISNTLAVSSNPRVERVKKRMLMGIRDFLPKPYTRTALLSAIVDALGKDE